ncbi:MAG: endonuclease/exonuclease/phosphatase family protein [Planctomycetota bacterium]|nr:endonuclease/exonuclease/phosphatase family protein [Planctomycetota bacterium]
MPLRSGRTIRRLRKLLASAATLAALLLALGWTAGRLWTDEHYWSQFLFWIPGAAWGGAVLLFAAFASILAPGAGRVSEKEAQHTRPRWSIGRLARLGMLGLATGLVTQTLIDRVLASGAAPGKRATDHLRVAQWNMSSPDVWSWEGTLAETFPDAQLVLFSYAIAGPGFEHAVTGLEETHEIRRSNILCVASAYPITRRELHALALADLATESRPAFVDRFQDWYNAVAPRFGVSRREFGAVEDGLLLELELDARASPLRRALRVWFIDLPSDPRLSRMKIARRAREAMDRLAQAQGDPDLIMGDFNIPRGSASLRVLAGGLAGGRAGGLVAPSDRVTPSWPRAMPTLHIDHSLVSPGARSRGYWTIDTGVSDHRAQVIDIEFR